MNKYIIFLLIVFLCRPAYADPVPKARQQSSHQEVMTEHIHRLLQHLGYPENTWGPIEQGLLVFLAKIDFLHLKDEAVQVKSDPLKLRALVAKLGALIEEKGYIQQHPPHPLVKLLTVSFANDDISQVIFTSPISFLEKVDSKKALVACTAISQLGSIILDLLDIKAKVVFSPAHVFNAVLLDDQQILFIDFSNQIFEIVDTSQYYYSLGSKTRMLKDQYSISPARLIEINAQLPGELRSDSLQELLCFLYHYIYVSDDDATTPAIFINLANIYARQGNYDQAFMDYDKAIALEPDYAEAYRERGITYGNKGDLNQAIADISKSIELFPDFAEGYHDRASVYASQGDIDRAIFDYNQAIIIDPDYAEAYRERGIMRSDKGLLDQAIADYDRAIEIDPYFSESYASRAEAYFSKGEFDKSWQDIHKIEDFGDQASPELVKKLKKISEHRYIYPVLIIAPILLLLVFRFL